MSVKTATVCPVTGTQSQGKVAVNGVNGEVKENGGVKVSQFREWRRPDLPSKCTYQLGTPLEKSPHIHTKL